MRVGKSVWQVGFSNLSSVEDCNLRHKAQQTFPSACVRLWLSILTSLHQRGTAAFPSRGSLRLLRCLFCCFKSFLVNVWYLECRDGVRRSVAGKLLDSPPRPLPGTAAPWGTQLCTPCPTKRNVCAILFLCSLTGEPCLIERCRSCRWSLL